MDDLEQHIKERDALIESLKQKEVELTQKFEVDSEKLKEIYSDKDGLIQKLERSLKEKIYELEQLEISMGNKDHEI